MTEAELKLVELDPTKQYVVMFKGSPNEFMWPDKPSNVSEVIINADHYTIEDIEKVKEALSNDSKPRSAEGNDAKK